MKTHSIKMFLSLFFIFTSFLLHGAEVDINGFLSHSVEIKLPPGTNGMAPNLSLEYNSGSGNGIVGQGWSLNGLLAITRDVRCGIDYDGKDVYIGSSGQLKLQSDGSYHNQYENFSKIQKFGTAGDGPAYWVETKPDGTKYYYGNYGDITTASIGAIGKNGSIRVWALSKVEDVNGNYYTVDYMAEDEFGEYYPKRIIYTQGNGISRLRVIDFVYEGRNDFWTDYSYGSAVITKKKLVKIEVNVDVPEFLGWKLTFLGDLVRTYELEYEGGSSGVDVSRIINVNELGSDNQIIDSTVFIWRTNSNYQLTWNGFSNAKGFGNIPANENAWKFTGDFNGDGKTDIGFWYGTDGNILLGLSAGTSFQFVSSSNAKGFGNIPASENAWKFTGDFNGDGKTDIGFWYGIDGNILLGLSAGNSFQFVSSSNAKGYGNIPASENAWKYTGDFNGDGKTDIGFWYGIDGNIWTGMSDGNSFNFTGSSNAKGYGNIPASENAWKFEDDFNGDGKTDIGFWYGIDGNIWTGLSHGGQGNNKIVSITNNSGSSTKIEYKNAADLTGVIDSSDKSFPFIANQAPRELVTSITVNDGKNTNVNYKKTYSYRNGKYLNFYRVNLYFETITETDTASKIITTTSYDQRAWYAGYPTSVVVTTTDNKPVKIEDYDYNTSYLTKYTGTGFVKLDKVTSTIYESGTSAFTQSKTFTYDNDGNTTYIVDHSDGTSDIETTISYDKVPTDNILNRPSEITKTSEGKIIDGKKYAYNGNKISGMSAYLDGTWVPTTYGTDACGNITSITDPANHTTSIKYDSDYSSFIAEVTNALGQKVTMEYDAGTGNPITKTDQNGNTTANEYDGAGRLIKVTNSEGDTVQDIVYNDFGNPSLQNIETRIHKDSGTSYSYSKSYFDGLGREYKKVSSAGVLGSALITQVVVTEYDTAGKISSKTIPYIDGKQTPLKTTYAYDNAGKVIKETRPDGTVIKTSYAVFSSGILVSKYDAKGNLSTGLYDSRGRLVKKTEPAGAQVTYSYDGAGRLTGTVDAGNHLTSITYDSLGRKTSISDPNTGDISYSYDLSGNLISKTDAIGNTISYSYDEINRLIKTDYPDDTPDVTYNYDESSSANGEGRVTSVESGEISTKYGYDSSGNAEYLRQTVDKIDFIFTMEYDTQNRVTALTYPDGTKIDREYSDTGYLKAVKQGTGAYIQYALKLDGAGAYKNTVRRVTGNGVDTAIAYNPANMRPVSIETLDKNNVQLEKNVYTYDLNGNITNINNTFDTPKTQTFEYDALNRLTKAKGVYGEQNFTYDPAGNLTSNSHGALSYSDSFHPYAVTSDGEGNSYTYDDNGSMLTGRGREMDYDAEGRLVSLKKDGTEIQKNRYDHTGHRVVQQKKDGTLIYNINGLYEIVKTPSRPDYHTKYIYGMENDLAAQVTTEGTTLVAANFGKSFIFDKGYGGNPFASVIAKGYIKADNFLSKAKNILKIQYAMVIILLAALIIAFIKSGITHRMKRVKGAHKPIWSSAVSFVLVISMIGSFSLTGCDDISTGNADVVGDGGSSQTADTAGLPTLGTYYFHPDHIGSVSYVTDSAGAVISRMSYTPYGEKIKSASSGPDIFHQKYTGQVDDGDEAELLYYNARYYDPKLGRFISADTMIPVPSFSQSFNRYMYVAGNPVSFNDPSGNYWGESRLKKIVNACQGDDAKNIYKGIAGGITPYYAYKNGGFKGGALWFSGGALSYSRGEGYGISISVNYKGFHLGMHWQQKGFNEGYSVTAGYGYTKGNFMAGGFVSYNINTQNTTLGIYAGTTNSYGSATVGYSVTYNKNGDIIAKGLMGSGGNNVLQRNFTNFTLDLKLSVEKDWTKKDTERYIQAVEDYDMASIDEWATNEQDLQDARMNFKNQDPLCVTHIISWSLSLNIPNVISPLTSGRIRL